MLWITREDQLSFVFVFCFDFSVSRVFLRENGRVSTFSTVLHQTTRKDEVGARRDLQSINTYEDVGGDIVILLGDLGPLVDLYSDNNTACIRRGQGKGMYIYHLTKFTSTVRLSHKSNLTLFKNKPTLLQILLLAS